MKRMKKLFALLMTLAMVMGLGITGFAAEGNDWTISVSGTGIDQATVMYGQIIKADPTSTQGWSFVGGNDSALADAFVEGWNNATDPVSNLDAEDVIDALFGIAEETPNANVEAGTIHDSANLSAALAKVTSYVTGEMTNKTADVEETGAGLYIVTAQREGYTYLPMAAYMDSDGTNVDVVAKGSEDQLVKVVDENGKSVAPGDVVNYTITQQYLYISPDAQNKIFTISDEIINGTINVDSIKVGYKDNALDKSIPKELIEGTDYDITWTAGDEESSKTGFTLDFGKRYNSELAGKLLVIEYSVTVNDEFEKGTTTVSNKATSSNGTGTIVETEPVSFEVTKKVAGEETLLGGAVFTIYKEVAEAGEGTTTITYNDETKNVIVVGTIETSSENDATLGKGTIDGLDAQATYYVKETKAPEGYSLNDTVYLLTGAEETTSGQPTEKEDDNVTYKVYKYTYSDFDGQTVEDTTLSELPSTGGMGTTLFTIAGCVIMISAAGLFFATRKKAN